MNSEFIIAVHCLVYLNHVPGNMATSEQLSDNLCVNAVRIRKVMRMLKKKGLISTKEGFTGGYIFKHNPKEVTLGQIYELTSNNSLASNWRSGHIEKDCVISSGIGQVMTDIFSEGDQCYKLFLDGINVQDVVEKLFK
ncbi:Rrf2 family transcriptional regulator [Bacillus cereus]|uniref:Rrf2 family transcriptional regulator n=1 Tax=Bacillus thuringiensis TaxID=1428 RepID=A0A7D4HEV5_BACTU|nr:MULTISPECIES: Rrf2 family transcriptional regulator [Bacillus cereus group]MDQ4441383.1 Rrf2 family transcriptional regulator [Bacillus cereus]QKH26959.1 Rrf2 family transcriptional regulator [Bacillus thuringiensis]QKH65633.1 Rrf2 family transcriptional regulator [Bacillus cereus]QKH72869.1 Rrf2 family transcriptional regulator [Bacillus cereus]